MKKRKKYDKLNKIKIEKDKKGEDERMKKEQNVKSLETVEREREREPHFI